MKDRQGRRTLTWAPSHSKAVAWPKTDADRPAEAEASGLPDGPQEPWSTDEGGFLRAAAVSTRKETVTMMNTQGGNTASCACLCFLPRALWASPAVPMGFGPRSLCCPESMSFLLCQGCRRLSTAPLSLVSCVHSTGQPTSASHHGTRLPSRNLKMWSWKTFSLLRC